MNIEEKIGSIKKSLPNGTKLIAVTKYSSIEEIKQAYTAGLRDFAENRLQNAQDKKAALSDLENINWHLIGSLQSNKVRAALQTFAFIHSVDSLKLANRINRIASELNLKPNILLQVKLAPDLNKAGFEPYALINALPQLDKLLNIAIVGLMTILPQGLSKEKKYELFSKLASLREQINNLHFENVYLAELSMGMSEDYLEAICAGSTMIRIGKALFK